MNDKQAKSDLVPTPEYEDIVFWLKTRRDDDLAVLAASEIENLRRRVGFLESIAYKYVGKGFKGKEGAD